jgi:hypothetical protein
VAERWEDLPIKNGEDDPAYEKALYRYAHIGCPGAKYEDVCAHPAECALRGRCKELYEHQHFDWARYLEYGDDR